MSPIIIRRSARLCSGLVLMFFTTGHLVSVSLGLISVDAMDHWRPALMGLWSTPVGQVVLIGALAAHIVLSLVSVAGRRSLSMRPADAAQIALGLLLPVLLTLHVFVIRGLANILGLQATYGWFLAIYWKMAPILGLQQVLVVVVAWVHGCLGLQAWLSFKPIWPRVAPVIYPIVVALPILALLGFVEGGKDALARLDHDPAFAAVVAQLQSQANPLLPMLVRATDWFVDAYLLIIVVIAAMFVGRHIAGRRVAARVQYLDGPTVMTPRGLTILEVSRANDVPHASLCSGRGRCGTCRVHIVSGAGGLSKPDAVELAVLTKVGAEKGTRLGCRARVMGAAVTVERLIAPGIDLATARDPVEAAEPEPHEV